MGSETVDELDRTSHRGGRLARAVDPRKGRLFPEPDQLPAGVVPVLPDDEFTGGGLVAHAGEHLDDLPVDQPAQRLGRGWHAGREQAADLVDDAARELLLDAALDPG